MRIIGQGIVHRGERDIATFPSLCVPDSGNPLAIYRVGASKEPAGSVTLLRRSVDGGKSWSEHWQPFEDVFAGVRGALQVVYLTSLGDGHLMAAACWVNLEAFPDKPLFNPATEGCLPMEILIADSGDEGRSWTPWRKIDLPADIGPASLTNPILRLPSGRLAISIETNKNYNDTSLWKQRVVYVYSDDEGRSWSDPRTVCHDPAGTLFSWDQRAAMSPAGELVTFSWTYHRPGNRYLQIQRRISLDEGLTWTPPEALGFADQPSHPAVLPDGSAVLAWVDRYETRSIRARSAPKLTGSFDAATEVLIYTAQETRERRNNTGELLSEMSRWSFGLPFGEALPDGDVLVVYYAGSAEAMDIRWARLKLYQ